MNTLIVFLASGLWHGASLSYVIWGGLNGIYKIAGEIGKPVRDKMISILELNRESLGHRMLQTIITFLLVDFSLIFFRAEGSRDALRIIKRIIEVRNPWIFFDGSLYECGLDRANFLLLMVGLGILLFADYCKVKEIQIRQVIIRQDYWFRWLFIAFAVAGILTFGIWGQGYDATDFIYFQF